jgi:hypothetical protein
MSYGYHGGGYYGGGESDGMSLYTRFRFNLGSETEIDSRHLGGLITLRSFVEQKPLNDVVQLMAEFFCQNGFNQLQSIDISGHSVFKQPDVTSTGDLADGVQALKSGLDEYRSGHPKWPQWGDDITMTCLNKDESFHHSMTLEYRPAHNAKYHAFKLDIYSVPNELVKGDAEDKDAFSARLKAFQDRMDSETNYEAWRDQQNGLVRPIVDKFFGYWQVLGIKDIEKTTEAE